MGETGSTEYPGVHHDSEQELMHNNRIQTIVANATKSDSKRCAGNTIMKCRLLVVLFLGTFSIQPVVDEERRRKGDRRIY